MQENLLMLLFRLSFFRIFCRYTGRERIIMSPWVNVVSCRLMHSSMPYIDTAEQLPPHCFLGGGGRRIGNKDPEHVIAKLLATLL